jgi:hypothetical protein
VSLVAFCPEEQVEAFGEKLTLRLDFRAITTIEGALNMPMPYANALIRSGAYGALTHTLWAMTREHHPDMTHDEVMAVVVDQSPEGGKVGLAVLALLDRIFPPESDGEDKKPKNARKRRGASKTSAAAG